MVGYAGAFRLIGTGANDQLTHRGFIKRKLHFDFEAIALKAQKRILRGRREAFALRASAFRPQRHKFTRRFNSQIAVHIKAALFRKADNTRPTGQMLSPSWTAFFDPSPHQVTIARWIVQALCRIRIRAQIEFASPTLLKEAVPPFAGKPVNIFRFRVRAHKQRAMVVEPQ